MLEAAAPLGIVHEIVGAPGLRDEYSFSKHFRDIHVIITQHGFINSAKLQPLGQIMLGLAPDWCRSLSSETCGG